MAERMGGSGGSSPGGRPGGPGGSNFFSRNWLQLTVATMLISWPLYSWYKRSYVDMPQKDKAAGGALDSAKEAAQAAKSTVYHGYEATKEGAEHVVHKVTDPVVDAAHRVAGAGHKAKDAVAAKGQDAYEAAEERWQEAKDATSRRVGQAAERGQEAASSARANVQDAAEEVADQSREKTSGFWESLRGGITGGADKTARKAHEGFEATRRSADRAADIKSAREASDEENRKRVMYSVGAVAVGLAVVGAAYWLDIKKGDGKPGAEGGKSGPTTFV